MLKTVVTMNCTVGHEDKISLKPERKRRDQLKKNADKLEQV